MSAILPFVAGIDHRQCAAPVNGSELVCVRGGWEFLDALPMSAEVRAAVVAARRYDEATEEFHDFTASRRNYHVAQGIGAGFFTRIGPRTSMRPAATRGDGLRLHASRLLNTV